MQSRLKRVTYNTGQEYAESKKRDGSKKQKTVRGSLPGTRTTKDRLYTAALSSEQTATVVGHPMVRPDMNRSGRGAPAEVKPMAAEEGEIRDSWFKRCRVFPCNSRNWRVWTSKSDHEITDFRRLFV